MKGNGGGGYPIDGQRQKPQVFLSIIDSNTVIC
jgi:hypothetical protein